MGPPLPPVRIGPAPPGPLRVRQIGAEVVLSTALPGTRTDGTRLGPEAEVRVLRLKATGTLRPGAVSDRYLVQQFQKQASVIAGLAGEDLRRSISRGRFLFSDRDAVATPTATEGQPPRFLYALHIVEGKNNRSPLRVPSEIEVAAPLPAPGGLMAEVAEGEVRLAWTPAGGGAEMAATVTLPAPGFNVYRMEAAESTSPEDPLNPQPLAEPSFVDTTFRYDVTYAYSVRAVDPVQGTLRESVASPPIEVRPHDRFAPMAPSGIAVAVEGAVIKVYWFPNAEPDLAGYRIYRRSAGESAPTRIGETPAAESSFIDPGAAPGVRYHYSVSAVDGADPVNESPRSEEKSEMLSGGGAA